MESYSNFQHKVLMDIKGHFTCFEIMSLNHAGNLMPITFKKQPVNSDINTLLINLQQGVSRGNVL